MLIIYDMLNQKVINNTGQNSLFPDGNIPELPELEEGQIYLRCNDNSAIAKQIMSAYDYELEYDNEGNITGVNVLKTQEEYRAENPPEPTEDERINDVENTIADIIGGAV